MSSYSRTSIFSTWAKGLGTFCSLLQSFVISRPVLFHIFYYYWGKENRSFYRGLHDVKVLLYIELQLKMDPMSIVTSAYSLPPTYMYKWPCGLY